MPRYLGPRRGIRRHFRWGVATPSFLQAATMEDGGWGHWRRVCRRSGDRREVSLGHDHPQGRIRLHSGPMQNIKVNQNCEARDLVRFGSEPSLPLALTADELRNHLQRTTD